MEIQVYRTNNPVANLTLESLLLSLQEQMFEEHEIAQMKFYEIQVISEPSE